MCILCLSGECLESTRALVTCIVTHGWSVLILGAVIVNNRDAKIYGYSRMFSGSKSELGSVRVLTFLLLSFKYST